MAAVTLETPQAAQHTPRSFAERREARHSRRMQMLAWRAMGYQQKEIAEAFGVSQAFVSQELARIQPKQPRPALPPLPKRASA